MIENSRRKWDLVERCPVCGRVPKYEASGVHYGRFICRGWFLIHLDTGWGLYRDHRDVIGDAARRWNELAEETRRAWDMRKGGRKHGKRE